MPETGQAGLALGPRSLCAQGTPSKLKCVCTAENASAVDPGDSCRVPRGCLEW